MNSKYVYGGTSDVGYGRTANEDYFLFRNLREDVLFVAISDGMGSMPSSLQPAAIVCNEAAETVQRMWDMDESLVLENPGIILREALYSANRVLGMFKAVDEEKYAGFNAAITVLLVYDNVRFAFAHVGNCRLNLIRVKDGTGNIKQLTTDHTRAMELLNAGKIDINEYVQHPDNYRLTSVLGVVTNFKVQEFSGSLKPKDILLLTTDGIHFGIRPDAMMSLIMNAYDWKSATSALTQAAKMEKVADNGTAVFVMV